MKKFMILVMALIGTQFASAAESEGSEIMHQAPVGKFELTPALLYRTYDYDLKTTSPSSAAQKGFLAQLYFEYGLDTDYSAGVILGTGSDKITYSPSSTTLKDYKQSGLEDPEVFFHGKYALSGGLLRYGVDVNVALGKEVEEASGDTNNASGGIGAEPFIGFEKTSAACTMGVKLAYKLNLADGKKRTSRLHLPTNMRSQVAKRQP